MVTSQIAEVFINATNQSMDSWDQSPAAHIANIADDICIIRSMHTEAINHDPALTFMQTGAQQGNRPSMGAWLSYGLDLRIKTCQVFVYC